MYQHGGDYTQVITSDNFMSDIEFNEKMQEHKEKICLLKFFFIYFFLASLLMALFQLAWFYMTSSLNAIELSVIILEIVINVVKLWCIHELYQAFKYAQIAKHGYADYSVFMTNTQNYEYQYRLAAKECYLHIFTLCYILGWLGGFYENKGSGFGLNHAKVTTIKTLILIFGFDILCFIGFYCVYRNLMTAYHGYKETYFQDYYLRNSHGEVITQQYHH